MKTTYLNGLSKMMLGLYGAGIIFGPILLAHLFADFALGENSSEAVHRAISICGAVYVFCITPFIFSSLVTRWRRALVEIIEK
jgi:hypothetical protein